MSVKTDSAGYLMEILKTNGVVAASVDDGHVIGFKRDFLQKLLDDNEGKSSIVIFVKHPVKQEES